VKTTDNAWPKEIKKTKQRQSVLSILQNSDVPLSAADIYSEMEKGGEKAWMSTIYRILELFIKHDMVIKTNILNHDVAVYELNRFEHKHYAVCLNCHRMISMDSCPMDEFIPNLEDKDFRILGHKLEIFGYCKDCKTA